jgi:ankyrin repeat protein
MPEDPEALAADERVLAAVHAGDAMLLATLLDQYPDRLHLRTTPYEQSLLHLAAQAGHLNVVDLLLTRGLDVNIRDKGDNTYAMHWAAAAGHLDVVSRLAERGGDVVGHGDDHALDVIGWATCWGGCDDARHRAVAEFLVGRGATHHIFSAIAMSLPDQVRRIVTADPAAMNRRMSRNENHQLPLHFAVRMNQPAMVALLMDLGADPLAVDGSGFPAAAYAMSSDVDRRVMEAIGAMTAAELTSAARGVRRPRGSHIDLMAALALGAWDTATRLVREAPEALPPAGAGVLHLMAKRNDRAAVQWLLDHGADVNARWSHWDAEVTPLHLAVLGGHAEIVRQLVQAGADPHIRDSKHDSDAIGWAEFFQRAELVQLLGGPGGDA